MRAVGERIKRRDQIRAVILKRGGQVSDSTVELIESYCDHIDSPGLKLAWGGRLAYTVTWNRRLKTEIQALPEDALVKHMYHQLKP
jgi:hypothetical protein